MERLIDEGQPVAPYQVDAADRAAVDRAVVSLGARFGAATLLVNNAGLGASPADPALETGPFETYPEAAWDAMIDSHLKSALVVSQSFVAQFRTARGGVLGVRPVDLLALRRDGRLVVIELKVSEAREHVLQGVDYWQRVEAHRRRGHIARAKLFGDRRISNEAPLVYLVAPTLRVHPAFNTLARSIAPDIEIYRFDINEDWRAGVRVMRRMRVN